MTCECLQATCDCRLTSLHRSMQPRNAYILLARRLLTFHQPRRSLDTHDQIPCQGVPVTA